MNTTSLKEIIDDILLLVRNNNISESEDFSRAQIAAWVNHYRRMLWKKHLDELKDKAKMFDLLDMVDGEFLTIKEIGPLELEDVPSNDDIESYTKRTKDEIDGLFSNTSSSIIAIRDESGENIQYMNPIRRHYQYFRRYTFGEITGYFNGDKHIYIQGLQDQEQLKYIYVEAIYEVDEDADDSDAEEEDEVKIPTWMVPDIKKLMFQNELAVMLNRPSDDSNNATLASVKPHGPQDDEE